LVRKSYFNNLIDYEYLKKILNSNHNDIYKLNTKYVRVLDNPQKKILYGNDGLHELILYKKSINDLTCLNDNIKDVDFNFCSNKRTLAPLSYIILLS